MADAHVELEVARLRRALAGDGSAFAELVRPHLAVMFRIAGRLAGNRSLAEDAVQEALTVAHQRLAEYRAGTSLRAYLSAIAARQAETLARGEWRRRRREDLVEPAAPALTPESELEAERVAERLRNVLAALPEKRRQVAVLRLDGGLSYAEIAETLETTEASARALTHLALIALRDALGELREGDQGSSS
jgi:RNA polymerase sigma-70 factor (ECF subfamily)